MAVGARTADYREPDLNRLGAEALDDATDDEVAAAFETRTAAVEAALHGRRLDQALVVLAPAMSDRLNAPEDVAGYAPVSRGFEASALS